MSAPRDPRPRWPRRAALLLVALPLGFAVPASLALPLNVAVSLGFALPLGFVLPAAAQDEAQDAAEDGAQNASEDGAQDAAGDAAQDAAQDTTQDGAPDAAEDRAQDATPDASEAVTQDGAPDAVQDGAPDAAQHAALNPLAALPADALRDLRERPLFSPSRALPQAVAEPPPAAPEPVPPPTAVLVGVMVAGGRSIAVVVDPDAATTTSVGIGDDVGGWEVAEIAPDHLVVTLDGRSETLRMFVPGRATPPSAGPAENEPDAEGDPPEEDSAALATATGEELIDLIRRRARARR